MDHIALMLVAFFFAMLAPGVFSATFTFTNKCTYMVWPGTLSGSTSSPLARTGFELPTGASLSLDATAKWSGRMWARTMCATDATGRFVCASGDCGSGQVECNGAGGLPPATLMEFTLGGYDGKDFYDTSLVDGYNVPVSVVLQGGSGCNSTGCPTDVNRLCPPELQVSASDGSVVGCKSACLAFGSDEYCCKGEFGSPQTCKPTNYSQIFKNACPQAYSYAYDDPSSLFTCVGDNYLITFCPLN